MVLTGQRPLLAISSCLLGQHVRYDGAQKRDAWLADVLGRYVDYRPLCPEVGIGLGVPRPPIRLVQGGGDVRVVGVDDAALDVTEDLRSYAQGALNEFSGVCGYVLKSKSPSCGLTEVELLGDDGTLSKRGRGIQADAVVTALPNLPAEDENRLNDPLLRENFVNRVYAYQRWRQLRESGITAQALLVFHARHKYMLMAHSQTAYRRLGRLLSDLKALNLRVLADRYEDEFMAALRHPVTRKQHVNALQHIQGYLKKYLSAGDKRDLSQCLEAYARGQTPLSEPVSLLRGHFRRFPDPYIAAQWYLQPYPDGLGLRDVL